MDDNTPLFQPSPVSVLRYILEVNSKQAAAMLGVTPEFLKKIEGRTLRLSVEAWAEICKPFVLAGSIKAIAIADLLRDYKITEGELSVKLGITPPRATSVKSRGRL